MGNQCTSSVFILSTVHRAIITMKERKQKLGSEIELYFDVNLQKDCIDLVTLSS